MMYIACLPMIVSLSCSVDQDILAKKAILSPAQLRSMSNDKSPVTRAELVSILTKLVSYLESSNKQKRGSSMSAIPPKTVRDLVKAGYLPADTNLKTDAKAKVTREDVSSALASILIRHNEKVVPITPDSRRATPIPHPSENNGS
jgi:hypothetical protein